MNMNSAGDDREHTRSPLRFELIFGSVWLSVGFFLLPALIYVVGVLLLGPYGDGAGLGTFYVDFFRDLAEPSGRAWAIALGPLTLISMVRAVFLGTRPHTLETDVAEHEEPLRPASESTRVEPRVGLD